MDRRDRELTFAGAGGTRLAARLDWPDGEPRGYALFAHCFTCSKDYLAPARIARFLAEKGVAVLRFDFTGLGDSCGEFGETGFSTNVEDVRAAATFLRDEYGPPQICIGHSLGGAAVLAAAPRISDARALVTLAAPSRPSGLRRLVDPVAETIRREGSAEVSVAGRSFRLGRVFLEDVERFTAEDIVGKVRVPLLVLHSPTDEVVPMEHAREIYAAASEPRSLVALDGVDHLVRNRDDARWIADLIDAWASRYLEGR